MVLEAATLRVRPGQAAEFEESFAQAQPIIMGMKGYLAHELQRCLDVPDQYLLLVHWETIEDHTVGFRQHPSFSEWRRLLHHYYDPPPTIQHYELVTSSSK